MTEESFEEDWYLVEGVARYWDGEKWRRFKWAQAPDWYDFQGVSHYWDGAEWDVYASSGAYEPKPKFKQDWEYALEDWEVKEQSEYERLENKIKQDWEYEYENPVTKKDSVFRTLAEEIEFEKSSQGVKPSKNNSQLGSQDYATKLNGLKCQICGEQPASRVLLQSASSRIIWWNHRKVDAPLCGVCAEAVFIDQQGRTLIQGWWGPISALATIWFSIANLQRISSHRQEVKTIEFNGKQIKRPILKVRNNIFAMLTTGIAAIIVTSFVLSYLSQPTPISDLTPTTYNGTCWQDKGNDKLSQVNCTSSDADYETYQVVSDPSLCASTYIAAGTQYACLQNKY